eukprot:2660504-Prymnesium_polylepis.1
MRGALPEGLDDSVELGPLVIGRPTVGNDRLANSEVGVISVIDNGRKRDFCVGGSLLLCAAWVGQSRPLARAGRRAGRWAGSQ